MSGPPEIHADQGNLDCGLATDPGNYNNYTTPYMMERAAGYFCKLQTDNKVKFEPGKVSGDNLHHELHYNNFKNDPVYVASTLR